MLNEMFKVIGEFNFPVLLHHSGNGPLMLSDVKETNERKNLIK